MNAESLCVPRDQPEKEREGEGERKKKRKTRDYQASLSEAHYFYFQKGLLYLNLYIEGNEKCKVIQSQPKHSSSFALIETRIFSANLSHK